jgi:farnesyl diphosphate synthase
VRARRALLPRAADTHAACACAPGLFACAQLLEIFHEVTYQTSCGQLIDLITAPIGEVRAPLPARLRARCFAHVSALDPPQLLLLLLPLRPQVDLSKYRLETYMRIVTYKTAFYTFYLPAASAMHLSGLTDPAAFALARDICVRLGQFFQIQDDYLDCYGDPAVIGKVGTDIEDNKCSWLVVQALGRCTDAQRVIFQARACASHARTQQCSHACHPCPPTPHAQENYGQNDPAKVSAIKAVYADLGLEEVYKAYEASSYAELSALITGQTLLPQALFMDMLTKIYKRVK